MWHRSYCASILFTIMTSINFGVKVVVVVFAVQQHPLSSITTPFFRNEHRSIPLIGELVPRGGGGYNEIPEEQEDTDEENEVDAPLSDLYETDDGYDSESENGDTTTTDSPVGNDGTVDPNSGSGCDETTSTEPSDDSGSISRSLNPHHPETIHGPEHNNDYSLCDRSTPAFTNTPRKKAIVFQDDPSVTTTALQRIRTLLLSRNHNHITDSHHHSDDTDIDDTHTSDEQDPESESETSETREYHRLSTLLRTRALEYLNDLQSSADPFRSPSLSKNHNKPFVPPEPLSYLLYVTPRIPTIRRSPVITLRIQSAGWVDGGSAAGTIGYLGGLISCYQETVREVEEAEAAFLAAAFATVEEDGEGGGGGGGKRKILSKLRNAEDVAKEVVNDRRFGQLVECVLCVVDVEGILAAEEQEVDNGEADTMSSEEKSEETNESIGTDGNFVRVNHVAKECKLPPFDGSKAVWGLTVLCTTAFGEELHTPHHNDGNNDGGEEEEKNKKRDLIRACAVCAREHLWSRLMDLPRPIGTVSGTIPNDDEHDPNDGDIDTKKETMERENGENHHHDKHNENDDVVKLVTDAVEHLRYYANVNDDPDHKEVDRLVRVIGSLLVQKETDLWSDTGHDDSFCYDKKKEEKVWEKKKKEEEDTIERLARSEEDAIQRLARSEEDSIDRLARSEEDVEDVEEKTVQIEMEMEEAIQIEMEMEEAVRRVEKEAEREVRGEKKEKTKEKETKKKKEGEEEEIEEIEEIEKIEMEVKAKTSVENIPSNEDEDEDAKSMKPFEESKKDSIDSIRTNNVDELKENNHTSFFPHSSPVHQKQNGSKDENDTNEYRNDSAESTRLLCYLTPNELVVALDALASHRRCGREAVFDYGDDDCVVVDALLRRVLRLLDHDLEILCRHEEEVEEQEKLEEEEEGEQEKVKKEEKEEGSVMELEREENEENDGATDEYGQRAIEAREDERDGGLIDAETLLASSMSKEEEDEESSDTVAIDLGVEVEEDEPYEDEKEKKEQQKEKDLDQQLEQRQEEEEEQELEYQEQEQKYQKEQLQNQQSEQEIQYHDIKVMDATALLDSIGSDEGDEDGCKGDELVVEDSIATDTYNEVYEGESNEEKMKEKEKKAEEKAPEEKKKRKKKEQKEEDEELEDEENEDIEVVEAATLLRSTVDKKEGEVEHPTFLSLAGHAVMLAANSIVDRLEEEDKVKRETMVRGGTVLGTVSILSGTKWKAVNQSLLLMGVRQLLESSFAGDVKKATGSVGDIDGDDKRKAEAVTPTIQRRVVTYSRDRRCMYKRGFAKSPLPPQCIADTTEGEASMGLSFSSLDLCTLSGAVGTLSCDPALATTLVERITRRFELLDLRLTERNSDEAEEVAALANLAWGKARVVDGAPRLSLPLLSSSDHTNSGRIRRRVVDCVSAAMEEAVEGVGGNNGSSIGRRLRFRPYDLSRLVWSLCHLALPSSPSSREIDGLEGDEYEDDVRRLGTLVLSAVRYAAFPASSFSAEDKARIISAYSKFEDIRKLRDRRHGVDPRRPPFSSTGVTMAMGLGRIVSDLSTAFVGYEEETAAEQRRQKPPIMCRSTMCNLLYDLYRLDRFSSCKSLYRSAIRSLLSFSSSSPSDSQLKSMSARDVARLHRVGMAQRALRARWCLDDEGEDDEHLSNALTDACVRFFFNAEGAAKRRLEDLVKGVTDLEDLGFLLWSFGRSGVVIIAGTDTGNREESGEKKEGMRRFEGVDVPTFSQEQIRRTSTRSIVRLLYGLLMVWGGTSSSTSCLILAHSYYEALQSIVGELHIRVPSMDATELPSLWTILGRHCRSPLGGMIENGCNNRRSPILSEAMMEENNEWGDGSKSGNLIDTYETQDETGSTEDDSSSSLSSSLSAQRWKDYEISRDRLVVLTARSICSAVRFLSIEDLRRVLEECERSVATERREKKKGRVMWRDDDLGECDKLIVELVEGIESELERRRSVVPRPMEYSRLPDGMLDDAVDAFEMGACRSLVDAIRNGSKS